jgi:hypothetical protein
MRDRERNRQREFLWDLPLPCKCRNTTFHLMPFPSVQSWEGQNGAGALGTQRRSALLSPRGPAAANLPQLLCLALLCF